MGNLINHKRPQKKIRYAKHWDFPIFRELMRQNKTKISFLKTKEGEPHQELVVLPKENILHL